MADVAFTLSGWPRSCDRTSAHISWGFTRTASLRPDKALRDRVCYHPQRRKLRDEGTYLRPHGLSEAERNRTPAGSPRAPSIWPP